MEKEEIDSLFEKNINLVYFTVNKYYSDLKDDDDLIQEGMIGLYRACKTWDPSKSTFSTYAVAVILNALRYELRKRNKQYNTICSIDDIIEDGDNCYSLHDLLFDTRNTIDSIEFKIVFQQIFNSLSKKEKTIISLLMQGDKQFEVAEKLGYTRSNVSRVQTKFLRELYNSLDIK